MKAIDTMGAIAEKCHTPPDQATAGRYGSYHIDEEGLWTADEDAKKIYSKEDSSHPMIGSGTFMEKVGGSNFEIY